MYKLGLLDLNGTVIKDLPVSYAAMVQTFRRFAPKAMIPTIESFCTGTAGIDMAEWYYQNGIPRHVAIEELYLEWGAHYRTHCHTAPLADGAKNFMTLVRQCGIPLIALSAGAKILRHHLVRLGVIDLFNEVILETRDKTSAINDLAKRKGIDPHAIFFIGDTADDVIQGNAAKVITIAYADGYHKPKALRAAKPKHLVHSFDEALAIVRSHHGLLA